MGKQVEKNLQDGIYLVKNGVMKQVQSPSTGFGKTIISWEANKPTRAIHECSEKL